jgi:hypothetical protein
MMEATKVPIKSSNAQAAAGRVDPFDATHRTLSRGDRSTSP